MTANATLYNDLFMPTPTGIGAWLKQAQRSISEDGIIDLAARVIPWIAPLPSAFFIYDAVIRNLHTHEFIAGVLALVIEVLGLVAIHTALAMHAWNRAHPDQTDKHAPLMLAVLLVLVYVLVALALIAVIEIFPHVRHFAPAIFPFLAIIGAMSFSMRSQHNIRIRDEREKYEDEKTRQRQLEDEDRADRREERRMKIAAKYGTSTVTSSVAQSETFPTSTTGDTGKSHSFESRQEAVYAALTSGQKFSATATARQLGVDRKTIYRDIDALIKAGRIDKNTNGHTAA